MSETVREQSTMQSPFIRNHGSDQEAALIAGGTKHVSNGVSVAV